MLVHLYFLYLFNRGGALGYVMVDAMIQILNHM